LWLFLFFSSVISSIFYFNYQDATHPVYLLDLMGLCWSQQPKDRPSASQIVSIASAPEFTHLLDVVSLNLNVFCTDGVAVPGPSSSEEALHELWLSSTACQVCYVYKFPVDLLIYR
jgi:hypothetical protein